MPFHSFPRVSFFLASHLLAFSELSCASASASTPAIAASAADEITALPGWHGELPSKQYSGYLDITATKHMHYWYVEAAGVDPNDVSTPTILWLNGGPGCSSLDGLFYEWGPFRVNGSTTPSTLYRYKYSTDNIGNVFYLESPVGVGFSYSSAADKTSDYNATDDTAAADAATAVELFFERFPHLKDHPFYITGESYGGVYVPTLAEEILHRESAGTYTGAKLKGIAVGNGCTGTEIGVCGGQRDLYDTLYLLGKAFIPESLKAKIHHECDLETGKFSDDCDKLVAQMHELIGPINLYNAYGDCYQGARVGDREFQENLKAPIGKSKHYGGPDACIDSRLGTSYLNQPAVIEAAHLHPIKFQWKTCASAAGWRYTSTRPNLPRDTYPFLVKNIRVVIYNGDWDACVPYTDNEAWTSGMGFDVVDSWHAWSYNSTNDESSQVGGYATTYKAAFPFTFVTVRGGRHEVPETAPGKALELMRKLVTDTPF